MGQQVEGWGCPLKQVASWWVRRRRRQQRAVPPGWGLRPESVWWDSGRTVRRVRASHLQQPSPCPLLPSRHRGCTAPQPPAGGCAPQAAREQALDLLFSEGRDRPVTGDQGPAAAPAAPPLRRAGGSAHAGPQARPRARRPGPQADMGRGRSERWDPAD